MLKHLMSVKTLLSSLIFNFYFVYKCRIKASDGLSIKGFVYCKNDGVILLGSNVKINSGLRYNPIVGPSKSVFITRATGIIDIEDNVGISNAVLFSVCSIKIKKSTIIGAGTCIWDTDFHSIDYNNRVLESDRGISKPIVIGENSFIGANVIILKGTTIGNNVTIGAGSIVSGNIPDNQVWGGNPAKRIR
ncbi:acyltransferase [Photobacterium kishitanii]|uniref:acyltransferase n=1 Tax=Photobacterium kishitanii TaxID=318456 RepID=UPI00273842FD|nr:acyltransferase [Photobacterium kishitanii]